MAKIQYNHVMPHTRLRGVYAAALTPLRSDGSIDLEGLPLLLDFLARRGCHGALLLGTTGEGPSFAPAERLQILRTALEVRQAHPQMRLLAGTGTPSLQETIDLTRFAFDLGYDGVVVLPPYYFRKASPEGLFAWFDRVLRQAVPAGGTLLYYHFPAITGMDLPLELLQRLLEVHPRRFAGLKDSSGDASFSRTLGERFGSDLFVLNGNDRLFSLAMQQNASGCITAMANLLSPLLRQAWDALLSSAKADEQIQVRLSAARAVLDRYPPMPPLLKALLPRLHSFPAWSVRPPLMPLAAETAAAALVEWLEITAKDHKETPHS